MKAPNWLSIRLRDLAVGFLRTKLFHKIACTAAALIAVQFMGGLPVLACQSGGKPITLAEALNSTLEHHPLLEARRWDVVSARGSKQEAAGQFDTLYQSGVGQQNQDNPLSQLERAQLGLGPQAADSLTAVTAFNFNISKLFRSGISVSSYMNLNRNSDNLVNVFGSSASQMGVQMIVPLLRNRGASLVTATETAAGIEVSSRQLDLQQAREQLLANTATSYWTLVAARQHLSVAIGSEERGRKLLETVQALITADHLPRNEIHEVTANLADRTGNRIAAEQEVNRARAQLALDMGLAPDQVLDAGDPADGFPPLDGAISGLNDQSVVYYVEQAATHRADIEAAEKREKQARILYVAALNSVRPQLNLQLGTGYSQLRDRGGAGQFFSSPFTSLHRPDFQAGFVYQFAHNNDGAKGQVLQAQAKMREAELQRSELRRQIAAAVTVALGNVRSSVQRLKSTNEAVEAFQRSLDGEREKFGLGQSSLTELLTVEDRLTVALSSQVDAQEAYALALAGLRLATGTLFPLSGTTDSVNSNVFQTIPGSSGTREPE